MPFLLNLHFPHYFVKFSFNLWKDIDWTTFYPSQTREEGETEEEEGWEDIRGFWRKDSIELLWPAGVWGRDPLKEIAFLKQLIGCLWRS